MDEFEMFIDAVERDSASLFCKYFKDEYLERKDKNTMQPIHIACYKGYIQMVQMLIARHCNLEACAAYSSRPIHFACARGHMGIVNILINQNCDIHAYNIDNWRPVHLACACGHVDILKSLIAQKCNLEICADKLLRPIHLASAHGQLEILKILIDQKCDIDACAFENLRPSHFACANGQLEVLKILIGHNCDNERKLSVTRENGNVKDLKCSLMWANIESCDEKNRRPIHLACEYGHIEIVKLLISKNCNIDSQDNFKCSPMAIAEKQNNKDLMNIINTEMEERQLKQQIIFYKLKGFQFGEISWFTDCFRRLEISFAHIINYIEWFSDLGYEYLCHGCNAKYIGMTARHLRSQVLYNCRLRELIYISKHSFLFRLTFQRWKMISSMGLQCNPLCDHKLCPLSLESKTFHKGEEIGSGSFGKVFHCRGSGIDRSFAIKSINYKEFDKRNIESNINTFLPSLKNVRIVQYFGAIRMESELCIFMEFLHEGSLNDKIIKEESIRPDNVIRYSRQILEGLEFLHGKKIIHRDLKPANILMDLKNNIKLTDFGISRLLIRTDGVSVDTKSVVGTPNFIAPEVINGEPYNVPVDIWSLGATIINMIIGHPPYNSFETPYAVIFRIGTTKKLEMPNSSKMSDDMKTFIESMLQPDPKDRPSASELLKSKFLSQ